MQNKRTLQIVIPVLIAGVVFGLYLFKNYAKESEPPSMSRTALHSSIDGSSESTADGSYDADSLYNSDIDMDKLTSYGYPIFMDFGSPSCVWCTKMAPDLKVIHNEFFDRVTVRYVDLSKNSVAASYYPVSSIPAQFFFNADGTPFLPSDKLQETVSFTFYESDSTGDTLTGHVGLLTQSEMRDILEEMVDVQ